VRERRQRATAVKRSGAETALARTSTPPAAVLALQRSAGNTATTRLLQRAPEHRAYAPAARDAISTRFRTNHIGASAKDAVAQHANRGMQETNTFVDMSDADAASEIRHFLDQLPVGEDIDDWKWFDFTTHSGYWCYETTLTDNATGEFEVREVFAKLELRAWWNASQGKFWIGHMYGLTGPDPSSELWTTITPSTA
jgi:hypothetical protein